jgi:hypothetical protein
MAATEADCQSLLRPTNRAHATFGFLALGEEWGFFRYSIKKAVEFQKAEEQRKKQAMAAGLEFRRG